MKISIDENIFVKYPYTSIGWLVAHIEVQEKHDYVENLKQNISHELQKMNINQNNYKQNEIITSWRKVFADFHRQNYVASVTALTKRVVNGAKMWNINSVVDLYNCYSILSLTPMGSYDMEYIKGDITLRYGKNKDQFVSLGADTPQEVNEEEIVYADEEKILCWLWNYRDSKFTHITTQTKKAIFFFDNVLENNDVLKKVENFINYLKNIDAIVVNYGVLNKNNSAIDLNI